MGVGGLWCGEGCTYAEEMDIVVRQGDVVV